MIIFLNGATSSGKTSIVKALQYLEEKPWVAVGIDTMINMMPHKYWAGGEQAEKGFTFISDHDQEGHPIMSIKMGVFGHTIANSLVDMVSLLDKAGLDIIVDEVLLGDELLKNYVKSLKLSKVYFIGIHCDLRILEEREILRGDRYIGSGRDQISRCHGPTRQYDLEVDTTLQSSFECVKLILNFIASNDDPKSFKTLREKFLL